MSISTWNDLEVISIENYKIFEAKRIKKINKESNADGIFTLIDSPDWVNIIPVSIDNKIVCVKQFRHGLNELTIEVPGGLIDNGETPIEAAMRECKEETGYISDEVPELIGISKPNPAFQNNTCYHYLWRSCNPDMMQNLDEHEDIEVMLLEIDEFFHKIKSGDINHSLVINAAFHLLNYELWAK